jgi:hypothetical protein
MDLLILNKLAPNAVEKLKKTIGVGAKSESFSTMNEIESRRALESIGSGFVVFMIVWTINFGVPAAILSWMANNRIGWNTPAKAIFSIFAFLFGLNYLLIHLVNKLDLLNAVKRLSASSAIIAAAAPPPAMAVVYRGGGRSRK